MKHGWHPLGFEWARGGGSKNKQRKEVLRSIASWGLWPTLALCGGLPYFTRIGLKLEDLGQ